jgi:ABC-type multidrug transport system fused ATPase/permease subunit
LHTSNKEKYYKAVLEHDHAVIIDVGTGELTKKIDNGIDAETSIYLTMLRRCISIGFRVTGIAIMFALYMPWMNILIISSALLVLGGNLLIKAKVDARSEILTKTQEVISDNTNHIITSHTLITTSNAQDYELTKLHDIQSPLPRQEMMIDTLNQSPYMGLELVFRVTEVAVYLLIGRQVYLGTTDVGTMMMMVTYIWWLRRPVSEALNGLSTFRRQLVKYIRMKDFIDTPKQIVDGQVYIHISQEL